MLERSGAREMEGGAMGDTNRRAGGGWGARRTAATRVSGGRWGDCLVPWALFWGGHGKWPDGWRSESVGLRVFEGEAGGRSFIAT